MILATLSQLFNFKALQPCICVIEDFTRKYIKLCFYPYRVMHFFHFLRFCFMVKKSHWLVFSSLFSLLSVVLAAVSLLHHLFPESQILQYEFYLTAMLHFFIWVSFFFSFYVLYQSTLISSPSPFFFVCLFFVIRTLSQQLIKKGKKENIQEKMKTAELSL